MTPCLLPQGNTSIRTHRHIDFWYLAVVHLNDWLMVLSPSTFWSNTQGRFGHQITVDELAITVDDRLGDSSSCASEYGWEIMDYSTIVTPGKPQMSLNKSTAIFAKMFNNLFVYCSNVQNVHFFL